MYARGLRNKTDVERFVSADYEREIPDPFLMKDMNVAVLRILKAIKSEETIAVFGDFDADGLCGTACLKDFFTRIGYENVLFHIPHRHDEGFGVSAGALTDLARQGATVVITVDCGIADIDAIEEASKIGLDVIITDHHEPINGLPKALAVVDPKRGDCQYPNKNLCGAGVIFKVVQGILFRDRLGIPEGHEKWFLDLVGIATIADSVPLVGENRVLARYGLLVLRKSPRVGIRKLCRKLYLDQRHLTEDDVGFMIAPRLNAASRMGDIKDAFTLLSTNSEREAEEAVAGLERLNNERKGAVASIVKEVKKNNEVIEEHSVIVTGNPKWRPSLLGLVANSLAEEYSKPVFLWGRDGAQVIKGSCRSSGGVDLLALMSLSGETFEQFGGHRFAGGFSVHFKQVHTMREQLNLAYTENGVKAESDQEEIDILMSVDVVDEVLYERVERLSPFGCGNPKPLIRFSNVLIKNFRVFGKQKNHLELVLGKTNHSSLRAIGFFMKPESLQKKPETGKTYDIIATVEKSFFRGREEIRLRLVDIV